jgi:hypothetical protein
LARFGKKSLAVGMIDKRSQVGKERRLERVAKLEPGFGPEHCRHAS